MEYDANVAGITDVSITASTYREISCTDCRFTFQEEDMPFINVKVIEGVFTSGQKQDIIKNLTDTMVRIEGENMRSVTWCVVEEVGSGDWGIAGQPLTTENVMDLARGAIVA